MVGWSLAAATNQKIKIRAMPEEAQVLYRNNHDKVSVPEKGHTLAGLKLLLKLL